VTGRIRGTLTVVLVVGAALAACTSQETGTASPTAEAAKTNSGNSGTSSAKTSVSLPPRPREIKLDGVDPCLLISTNQMKQLGVVKAARNDDDIVKSGPVPFCDYRNSASGIGYGVGAISNRGVDYWKGNGNTDVSIVNVAGYGAVRVSLSGTNVDCAVSIDVADGQQLYVDFIPTGIELTKEQLCQNVTTGAELALATLQTSR
jgi:hypothetical protein